MGTIPLTAVTEAKDGYQLSLVGLCIFILAIIWAVRYITEREKAFSAEMKSVNATHVATVLSTNSAHMSQIERLNEKHNEAIERLIESHREVDSVSIERLTSVVNELCKELHLRRKGDSDGSSS